VCVAAREGGGGGFYGFLFRGKTTHTFPDPLDVFALHADAADAAQMPAGLPPEVLQHEAGQDDELGVDAVEDAVVGEVQAVGDLLADPAEVAVGGHVVFGDGGVVVAVDFPQPGLAALDVLGAGFPVLPVAGVLLEVVFPCGLRRLWWGISEHTPGAGIVPVFFAFPLCNHHHRLQWFRNTYDGHKLDERLS
jgi:hypothetical protein